MENADVVAFLGRLHPVVLHLPIGLLAGVALLELVGLFSRKSATRSAPVSLVVVAALSAIAAAVSGILWAREPAYGGDSLEWHRWLGIAVASLCTIAAIFRVGSFFSSRVGLLRTYRLSLLAAFVIVGVTGHLGGTMTHGADFLTEPLFGSPKGPVQLPQRPTATTSASAPAADGPQFEAVAAFFTQRCISCHGESRRRGGLALHTPESLAQGGDRGPVVVRGDVAASELVRRLRLPVGERKHMPPSSKAQPSEEELHLIEQWVRSGAACLPDAQPRTNSPDAGVDVEDIDDVPPGEQDPADPYLKGSAPAQRDSTASAPAASVESIRALQSTLAFVAPIGEGSSLLAVDFAAARVTLSPGEIAELLRPVAASVADLKIARRSLDDALAPVFGAMVRLKRLDVRGSTLSESCVQAIGSLPALEELTVVGATLPTTSVAQLLAGPMLTKAYLWKSNLAADEITKARAARPALIIDAGEIVAAAALETEPEIKFTSDALVPGAAPAGPSLKPGNTLCPVSGSAVDPRFAIVHDGKVIGFCCPNCPGEFWKDPAKYAPKP